MSTSYFGLAIVVGQDGNGSSYRYLMLQPPLEREGRRITFAQANSADLEVVIDGS